MVFIIGEADDEFDHRRAASDFPSGARRQGHSSVSPTARRCCCPWSSTAAGTAAWWCSRAAGIAGVGRVAAPVAGDARRPAEKEEATAACMLVVLFVGRMARGGLETTNNEEVRADRGGGARWSSTMRPRIDDEE